MLKTIQISTEAYSYLLDEKSKSVKAIGKSPTYSFIIIKALKGDLNGTL